jgi:beta-carotene hydroxylase
MFVEAVGVFAIIGLAAIGWRRLPELALYATLVILGSWLYPLATVWWPHRSPGVTPLQQTRGFRGRIIPALFFQHTYHLEHHLYPGISSHRWAELGRRLEPHLARAGVRLNRLP